jgi:hypothetical protein
MMSPQTPQIASAAPGAGTTIVSVAVIGVGGRVMGAYKTLPGRSQPSGGQGQSGGVGVPIIPHPLATTVFPLSVIR